MKLYLYGMVCNTICYYLNYYPQRDGYAECSEIERIVGGETGTSAIVLDSLGCECIADGNWQDSTTMPTVETYFAARNIDFSALKVCEDGCGVFDTVLVCGSTRTVLGQYGAYFSDGKVKWNTPQPAHLVGCSAAGVDPFFGAQSEAAAQHCLDAGIGYVTIDCAPESFMHRHCAVNAVSHQHIESIFPGMSREEALDLYAQQTDGLTIITGGGGETLYKRRGGETGRRRAFAVDVRSTLGAGDTFKAGCIYALGARYDDDTLVEFASACAASACMSQSIPHDPPTLEKIRSIAGHSF